MDPLHATIALGPVAIYLLMLGVINLSTRPFVTSGIRDTAALGVAVSGFVVAGPMELFLPATSPMWAAWAALILSYALGVTLIVLLQRPRIVIYNVTPEQLRPVFANVIRGLDKEARVAGESVFFPNLGVHLHVEPLPMLKNVQLKPSGPVQSYQGWHEIQRALKAGLRENRGTANPYGVTFLMMGALLTALIGWWMARDGERIAHSWDDMIQYEDTIGRD
jgi:hypothetical protein